jgi:hypothetical protein
MKGRNILREENEALRAFYTASIPGSGGRV